MVEQYILQEETGIDNLAKTINYLLLQNSAFVNNTAKKEGASYFTEDAENDTVVNDCFFSGNIDHYDKKLNEEYHDSWKKLQEKMENELEDKKLPIDERTKKELPIGRINT